MNSIELSFEDALKELETIAQKLEHGDLALDESIDIFQRGIMLSKYCNTKLDEAEKKISLLIEDDLGNIQEKDFNKLEVTNGV